MNYNFKQIRVIPAADDLINIVLSKTSRQTPSVIHKGNKLSRIRGFYMRKVKFTQATLAEKFQGILEDFPKLDDIHPFYADLLNVLYDKDHYKLALGHVHSVKTLVTNIAKDYARLLKYGDSLYRCKLLKRAALGRMCTMVKKLKSSLSFLEEVRKHLGRLPSINPFERTLLITGFPNVGKSSFINQITNANVDVQPYPFTTQSLYVGHTDYNYVRWQVIDTPGILDHSLEQRNTIEMQAITALAHLKACILFFIDISSTCGHTIEEQVSLFNNIKPLFANKPLILVFTKSDLIKFDQLGKDEQLLLNGLAQQQNQQFIVEMSNKSGEGINDVKTKACDILLDYRLNQQPEKLAGGSKVVKQDEQFLRGVHVAFPKKRDDKDRQPQIPEVIQQGQKLKLNRPTLKEMEDQMGGAGVFNFPLQEHFMLENDAWKYDLVPEILDGKNIADYVDKDILEKLKQLEEEEEMFEKAREMEGDNEEMQEEIDPAFKKAHKEVKAKKSLLKMQHKQKRFSRGFKPPVPLEQVSEKLKSRGLETEQLENRINSKRRNIKLSDIKNVQDNQIEMEEEVGDIENQMIDEVLQSKQKMVKKLRDRERSMSRSRSQGYQKVLSEQDQAFEKMREKIEKTWKNTGKAGIADRRIQTKMPKHMFSGKSGFKRNRR